MFQTETTGAGTDETRTVYIDQTIDSSVWPDFQEFLQESSFSDGSCKLIFDLLDIDQTASVFHGWLAKLCRQRQVVFRGVTSETSRTAEILGYAIVVEA